MNVPDDITTGLEPAVLGAGLGTLLGELAACVLPLAGPTLPIVLFVAGQCALVASIAAAFARRVDGLGEAFRTSIPGLIVWTLLTGAALLAGPGAQ